MVEFKTKQCKDCGDTLIINSNITHNQMMVKHDYKCKVCRNIYCKKWEQTHPNKVREYRKKRYLLNKEQINKINNEWYSKNITHARDKRREWKINHKNYDKMYYSENRERLLLKNCEYRKTIAGKIIIRNCAQRRRSRINNTPKDSMLSHSEYIEMHSLATHCHWCGVGLNEDNKSLDHVVPLCLGGWHSKNNVVICCKHCNFSKREKKADIWLKEKFGAING